MVLKPKADRDLHFIGDVKDHSILIGNFGDAKITAIGGFDISGLIFCRSSRIQITMSGEGTAKFKGICKELIIRRIEGACELDLSELNCKSVKCEFASGHSVIQLGTTKSVELVSVNQTTTFHYKGHPFIYNHSDYNMRGGLKRSAAA